MSWKNWPQRASLLVLASIGILRMHIELSVVKYRLRRTYGPTWVMGHFANLQHFRLLGCDVAILRRAWSIGLVEQSNSTEIQAKRLLKLLNRVEDKPLEYRTHAGQLYAKAALSKIASRHGLAGRIRLRSDLSANPSGGLKAQMLKSLKPLVDHSSRNVDPALVRKLLEQRKSLWFSLATRSVQQDLKFQASQLFAIPKSVLAVAKP